MKLTTQVFANAVEMAIQQWFDGLLTDSEAFAKILEAHKQYQPDSPIHVPTPVSGGRVPARP